MKARMYNKVVLELVNVLTSYVSITKPGGVTKRKTLDRAGHASGNGCGYSTVLLCHRLVVGDFYTREGTHYAPILNYGYIATGVGALHGGEMVTHTEQKTVSSLEVGP